MPHRSMVRSVVDDVAVPTAERAAAVPTEAPDAGAASGS